MLERRAGEDNFRRLLQRLLAVSQNAAATGQATSVTYLHGIKLFLTVPIQSLHVPITNAVGQLLLLLFRPAP